MMEDLYGKIKRIAEGQGFETSASETMNDGTVLFNAIEGKKILSFGIKDNGNGRCNIGCGVMELNNLDDLGRLVMVGKEIKGLFDEEPEMVLESYSDNNRIKGLALVLTGN